MELYPGAVVAGRYRFDRKIGSGGMGEVWAGEHVGIGKRVALKTLLPGAAFDRQLVARFRREAQLLGRLRSERVARVVDFVEDRQVGLLLVMDLIEGEPLGEVLLSRRMGVEEAVDLGVDLASALCDLHLARVVHRDLKPDNVILEPLAGGRRRAVIVDLGVGRLDADLGGEDAVTSITMVDMAVGTLPYMAPEQLLSSSTATASADVYALGAILYRAVSGEQVFGDADDAVAARRKLSGEAPPLPIGRVDRVARGFTAVVAKALRRKPEDRFESAEQILRELAMLQDLYRATSIDLEGTTEEALPISAFGVVTSLPGPSTDECPPPVVTAPPTAPSPGGLSPAAQSVALPAAPADEPTGGLTRRMPRPPLDDDDSFDDEATQIAPASQALPRAAPADGGSPPVGSGGALASQPPASGIADPLTVSSPSLARPTVVSPTSPTLKAPTTIDEPPRGRTVALRTAVLGLIVALLAGTALGFEAHRLVTAPAAPKVGAGR